MGVEVQNISPGDGKYCGAVGDVEGNCEKLQLRSEFHQLKSETLRHAYRFSGCLIRLFVRHSIAGTTFPKQGQTAVVHYTGKQNVTESFPTMIKSFWVFFRYTRRWHCIWFISHSRQAVQIQGWQRWSDPRMGWRCRQNEQRSTCQIDLLARFCLRSAWTSWHYSTKCHPHLWCWTFARWISIQSNVHPTSIWIVHQPKKKSI